MNVGDIDDPQGVLKAFLPQNFLLEILSKMEEDIIENKEVIKKMQKEWLSDFDNLPFESVFVHWNVNLRERSM